MIRTIKTVSSAALLLLALLVSFAHAQSVVLLDNFEVNFDGWTNRGDYVYLDATAEARYAGARGMSVTGRKSAEDGAMSNKGFYLDGGPNYNYSVYVKHAGTSAETFNLTVTWLMPDKKTTGSKVIATTVAQPDAWTRITASHATPEGSFNPTFVITTNSTVDFYFDEFEVRGRSAGLAKSAAPMGATAIPADVGLKDVYARHFRVGNILNGGTVNNAGIRNIILLDYNSVTAENEHKPYATMTKTGSTNTNIQASLSSSAAINDFLARNGIPMRGHVLTWHGQSPDWFFVRDINDPRAERDTDAGRRYRNISVSDVPWASVTVMNQRLESYIRNLFAEFQRQYPSMYIYAYDVVNEAFDGNGNMRRAGFDHDGAGGGVQNPSGSGNSPWQAIYGAQNTEWMANAFRYARQYAPAHTKLFYNDFNEWQNGKMQGIRDKVLIPLRDEGVLDGMGMQSHVSANRNDGWSGERAHLPAMDFYADLGIEVQLTELDPNTDGGQYASQQPTRYANIFRKALEINRRDVGKITAIIMWTPSDAHTWIGSENSPALHDRNNNRKPAYDSVAAIIPQSQWGDGNNPTFEFGIGGGGGPTGPNEWGWWFIDTFEENLGGWGGRAGETVATSTATRAMGNRSLQVAGRTATWHGAIKTLPRAFVAGTAYAFSVCVVYLEGGASVELLKFTLQYTDAGGEARWMGIDSLTAARGQWVHLRNSNVMIPAGATNLSIIVESPSNAEITLYIDEVIGAVGGTGFATPEGVSTSGTTSVASANKNIARPLVTIRGRMLSISPPVNATNLSVKVIDARGKVRAKFNAEGSARFGLTKIPAGRYFVEVKGVGVQQMLPIVVK